MADSGHAAQASEPLAALRPQSLHHTAYVTHDTAATVDFYTRILGMPLISAVIDGEVPSTGDPWPYIHLFFEMQDGSTIAFFETLGLPEPSAPSHAAYDVFNHLALNAGSRRMVDTWVKRLRDLDVEVLGPVDHGIIYSAYFRDPNGLRLELTTDTEDWKAHAAKAQEDVAEWIALKSKAALEGNLDCLRAWIDERGGQHKIPAVD